MAFEFVGLVPTIVPSQATVTIIKPVGVITDTLMIAFIAQAGNAAANWTPPSGWTQIGTVRANGGEHQSVTYYKVAGSSEPADYTWSEDNVNRKHGYIIAINGVDPVDPIDVHQEIDNTSDGGGISIAVTTTGDNKLLFAAMSQELHEVTWVNNESMTLRYAEFDNDQDDFLSVAGFTQLADTAGLYTRTFDHSTGTSTGNSTGHLVALNSDGAQFARPVADVTVGTFTNQSGGSTNLFESINEEVASDTDFIRSANTPSSAVYVSELSSVADPSISTSHILRYRYDKEDVTGTPTVNLTVELRQGYVNESTLGTLIASNTHSEISDTITDGTITLSGTEADTITDYSDLFLRFILTQA